MRIPLIERIRFKHAAVFATVLFMVQEIEHTDMTFASLTFFFILLSTIAFNAAGGLLYPSGWFVLGNAMLTAIVALSYKVFLGEPGQTNLRAPNLTMFVYCIGMALMVVVAQLTRKLRPKRGLLTGMGTGEDMKKAAFGAFVLGTTLQFLTYSVQESGSFLAIARQINFFTQFGVLLATFYEVKRSRGVRSTNWIVWGAGLSIFITGIIGFSKQGLLTSMITWLVTAIVAGHSFSRKQVVGLIVWFMFFQVFLVPYAEVGRNFRSDEGSLAGDIKAASSLLPQLPEVRRQYLQDSKEDPDYEGRPHLYDQSQGFFDRLNMLSPDDALVAYTAEGNVEGLLPTWWAILNVVPHFIWKDKPFLFTGNLYAREIGMIADENDVTGVSFSPVADAFHEASFWGVALLWPPLLFIVFMVMDSLSGDIRESPWGILFSIGCLHAAPEGMLAGLIAISTTGAFAVVVAALLAKYLLPVVSGVLTNSDRTRVRKTLDFQPSVRPRSRPFDPNNGPAPENP